MNVRLHALVGLALLVAVLGGCAAAPVEDSPLANGQPLTWESGEDLAAPDAVFTDPPEHVSAQTVVPPPVAAGSGGSSGSSSGSSGSSSGSGSSGASPRVFLARGGECTNAKCVSDGPATDYYFAVSVSGFPANTGVSVTCNTGGGSGWSYSPSGWSTDGAGNLVINQNDTCFGEVGAPTSRWVTINGVTSNTVAW